MIQVVSIDSKLVIANWNHIHSMRVNENWTVRYKLKLYIGDCCGFTYMLRLNKQWTCHSRRSVQRKVNCMVNRGSYKRLSMLYDRLGVERPVVAMVAGCKGSASIMLDTRQTCLHHGNVQGRTCKGSRIFPAGCNEGNAMQRTCHMMRWQTWLFESERRRKRKRGKCN